MISNLPAASKSRLKAGDILFLKKTLEAEYDEQRTLLITAPESTIKQLQGSCKVLGEIIKLLP